MSWHKNNQESNQRVLSLLVTQMGDHGATAEALSLLDTFKRRSHQVMAVPVHCCALPLSQGRWQQPAWAGGMG